MAGGTRQGKPLEANVLTVMLRVTGVATMAVYLILEGLHSFLVDRGEDGTKYRN